MRTRASASSAAAPLYSIQWPNTGRPGCSFDIEGVVGARINRHRDRRAVWPRMPHHVTAALSWGPIVGLANQDQHRSVNLGAAGHAKSLSNAPVLVLLGQASDHTSASASLAACPGRGRRCSARHRAAFGFSGRAECDTQSQGRSRIAWQPAARSTDLLQHRQGTETTDERRRGSNAST